MPIAPFRCEDDFLARINLYKLRHGFKSRSQAMRRLIELGLDADERLRIDALEVLAAVQERLAEIEKRIAPSEKTYEYLLLTSYEAVMHLRHKSADDPKSLVAAQKAAMNLYKSQLKEEVK